MRIGLQRIDGESEAWISQIGLSRVGIRCTARATTGRFVSASRVVACAVAELVQLPRQATRRANLARLVVGLAAVAVSCQVAGVARTALLIALWHGLRAIFVPTSVRGRVVW